jgi:hypothetical protein
MKYVGYEMRGVWNTWGMKYVAWGCMGMKCVGNELQIFQQPRRWLNNITCCFVFNHICGFARGGYLLPRVANQPWVAPRVFWVHLALAGYVACTSTTGFTTWLFTLKPVGLLRYIAMRLVLLCVIAWGRFITLQY